MRGFFGYTVSDLPPLKWFLTFSLNFYIIKYGQGFLFFIVFLWSIAVEEQFYIFMGIILRWLKIIFVPICILLIAGSLVFRYYYLHDSANLYFNSLSWIGTFAMGGLLAWFCAHKGKAFESLKKIPVWFTSLIYTLFVLNFIFYTRIYASDNMVVAERFIASLFFAFLIFEQSFCEKHLFQFGKIPFVNYLGRISYGLFCYHGLIILIYGQTTQDFIGIDSPLAVLLINPVIIFVLTLVIASFSYEYFEKPIMSLRRQYRTA